MLKTVLYTLFLSIGLQAYTQIVFKDTIVTGYQKSFIETRDSGFLFYHAGNLQKLNKYGKKEWGKSGFKNSSSFNRIVMGVDDGYIIGGHTDFYKLPDEDNTYDIVITKINEEGEVLWEKAFPSFTFRDIMVTKDGNYLILGTAIDTGTFFTSKMVLVYKLDISGNVIWENRYFVNPNESLDSNDSDNLYEFENYYYISSSYSKFGQAGLFDGIIYKIDKNGKIFWTLRDKAYGGASERKFVKSIFMLNNKLFFNSFYENRVYEIKDDGSYEFMNKKLNIWNYFKSQSASNYDLSCNEITSFTYDSTTFYMKKYNEIDNYFYKQPIDKLVVEEIIHAIKTKDGGFAILREVDRNNKINVFTKTDCFGNIDFWDEECTKKLKPNQEVVIYPNPTTGLLNIETNFDIRKIIVIDNIGKEVVFNNYCNCGKQTIDVSAYTKGTYFLKIIGADSFQVQRFVLY